MKIFLAGASGMIGSRILTEAVARGHEVIAGARHPEKIAKGPTVTPVKIDATDPATLRAHAAMADVYVQSVSPRSTGDAVAEMAAYTKALLEVVQGRLVVVGGAGTLNLPDGTPVLAHLPDFIVPEATGMKALRNTLEGSDLNWTFIAPAADIQPGERTGTFRLGGTVLVQDAEGNSRISAEDYAIVLMDEVESAKHPRQVITAAY